MVFSTAFEFSNTASANAIAEFVKKNRPRIFQLWVAAIRRNSTGSGEHIVKLLREESKTGSDLLTIFGYTLTGQKNVENTRFYGLVEKVRTREYSVSELFYEVFSLQDAFEKIFTELGSPDQSEITANLNMTRSVLGRIFSAVLEQTSWVYEHVTESGKRGFCQMDKNGLIIYCNQEMERIFMRNNIKGEHLQQLFPDSHRDYIKTAIEAPEGTLPASRELEIPKSEGGTITVWAEVEPVYYGDEHIGSYAMFTDISPVAKRERNVFQKSKWCVVRLDSLGKLTYANDKALSLLFSIKKDRHDDKKYEAAIKKARSEINNYAFYDFVNETEDKTVIEGALKKRLKGESSAYNLTIKPQGKDTKPVEVEVSGVPITDAEGHPVGSIGVFHSRMIDETSEAINAQIAATHNPEQMLVSIAETIYEQIPFDLCIVARYSKMDEQQIVHCNPFFTRNPQEKQDIWLKTWTPLSEQMVRWLQCKTVQPYILDTFLQLDEWKDLADDPDVKNLQAMGIKSFIFRVINNGDGLVSSFSLLSRDEKLFDDDACHMFKNLPLDNAMLMALHHQESQELAFRYELTKDIAKASSLSHAADIFVRRLQEEYKWLHVSLFRVDRRQHSLILQSQSCADNKMRLPEGYQQPLGEGILGDCYNLNKVMNSGNVDTLENFKPGITREDGTCLTKSELCCPIITDGYIHWLINIEDEKINAFCSKEEQLIEKACEEFGTLIERLARNFSFQACFKATTDPVIITDTANEIVRANPAAQSLLNENSNTRLKGPLKNYFTDEEQADILLNESRSAPTEVTLQKSDQSQNINMLMSCCKLPDEFGEKVYISKDLSRLRRMEELNYLSKLSYEVAAQSQSALSLAFTWLRELRDNPDNQDTDIPEISNKIMRQLRKVSATHDRIAFYDDNASLESEPPIKLNLLTEIKRMLGDFPESDSTLVELPDREEVPYILADPVSISFILESLFSYLLRYASSDRKIIVQLQERDNLLQLIVSGSEPLRETSNEPQEKFLERMRTDIAIGKQRLQHLIESQHGQLVDIVRNEGSIAFTIQFPIITMEEVA